jgi:5-methylcytosine-specific restriction protein A
MAKTHGHGNPDWSRDEVILALDLYLSCGGTVPGASDPRVKALSMILRDLSLHPASSRVGSFRNPDGVSFKLQNIRQVASGEGLANVSRVDREVWAAYGDKPAEVKRLAGAILSLASPGSESTESDEGEDIFVEGGILTAYHRRRERSPKLRKALLAKRSKTGKLCCDACDWAPANDDGRLSQAAFEAHHLLPLSTAGESKTKVSDVALLCANCHRLVHRWISITGEWLAADKIKSLVVGGGPQH